MVVMATRAQAQSFPPPIATSTLVALPPVPELRLSWPVSPLRFTYTQSEVTGYANGPLQLLRAEALWLDAPGLQLVTVGSQERAFELDCRLGCQPIVQRQLAFEARLPLPEFTPVVSSPYAYVRSSTLSTPSSARVSRQLTVGFAGALNF
jgi:hypothetical protein